MNNPNVSAKLSMVDSSFEGNRAPVGGAMFLTGAFELDAEDVLFHHNTARFGGAVEVYSGGNATFAGCNFTHDLAYEGGGEIFSTLCVGAFRSKVKGQRS